MFNTPTVAIFLGVICGLILHFCVGTESDFILQKVLSFNENVFFVFLLPPIIFASGFNLNGKQGVFFFYRFGTILWFALFATFLSFLLSSTGLWFAGSMGISLRLSFKEALILGAILSPTDPITVLSLFRDIKISPLTEIVVLGESLLNDAVAILLYRLIQQPGHPSGGSALAEIAAFGWQFLISMFMGLLMCLLLSLIMKITSLKWLKESEATINSAETAVTLVSPWITYLLAEKARLSGVVAVLFCGIGMARYTLPNFSDIGVVTAKNVYQSFSALAETVVFVLLGLSAFSFSLISKSSDFSVSEKVLFANFHLVTLVVVSLSRILCVYCTAAIVNFLLRNADHQARLPASLKAIVSLSGLRGAVTVALALKAKSDLGNSIGTAILSTCLTYTLFTIVIVGPALPCLFSRIPPDPTLLMDAAPTPAAAQPSHLLCWRHLIFCVRRLDTVIFNLVTRRSRDGGFWGDATSPPMESLDQELVNEQFFDDAVFSDDAFSVASAEKLYVN
eukprot:Gregarina_sp_Poly_1__4268@NODE_2323_length_2297_cov_39_165022_g1487_i0_p1_GENE_NODE_2323_length_2297_cov_39_165022_g1487_i0NODE_2323_length_2297_cov_39_165022_g1487_i0_p1_ORF_typecomplete_len591_score75_65Na_H_Exchanger/PF00999_21/8_9e61DUF2784/PF10861_8/1_8e03DUF2784/PF10861_8/1_2e04DUF2784/PF10861_8/0_17DUF3693/PF12472_8/3_8e03DUF3693/PF12472_8/0_68_NODE_2323_length_2297_cov_39_165022_g1487_i05232046